METAGLAINVECPRCKKSAPIDAEDFQATKVMDCPLRCGAHWCKNCHREIPRGQLHSCDGEEEFKALIQAQSGLFKKCPSEFHMLPVPPFLTISGPQNAAL
jgi:hypothetical protein